MERGVVGEREKVGSMRKTLEERKKEYRTIYEILYSNFRINVKSMASLLDSDRHSINNRLREAFDMGYVSKPSVEKRSYRNLREFVYFLECENPADAFDSYSRCNSVRFVGVMGGPTNVWLVTKEEIEVDATLKGVRSDYHVPFTPSTNWDESFTKIQKRIEDFNLTRYTSHKTIGTHWDEDVEWDKEDQRLFDSFQHDLRKKLTPIMKKNLISGEKIYKWFDRLPKTCTVFTQFFPEGIAAYDPCVVGVTTEYEGFIVEVFSQFPTTPVFFTVGNTLFCCVAVKKSAYKNVSSPVTSADELELPLLLRMLQRKGCIRTWWYSPLEYYTYV